MSAHTRLADMPPRDQAITVVRMMRAAGLSPRGYDPQEALQWALGQQRKETDHAE